MKTLGVSGGLGPESTIEYYRAILAACRERHGDVSVPSVFINSIDLHKSLELVAAGQLEAVTGYLVEELERLANAGTTLGILAANTPHVVFDDVVRRSAIPLVSIVEATRDKVQTLGLKRPGLFGTGFTMRARFYPDAFAKAGLPIVTPNEEEKAFIHEKYFGELLKSVFLPKTRTRLLEIVDRMRDRDNIDGLILAGTELPLILRASEHNGIPLLDTTKIHVDRIVERLLS